MKTQFTDINKSIFKVAEKQVPQLSTAVSAMKHEVDKLFTDTTKQAQDIELIKLSVELIKDFFETIKGIAKLDNNDNPDKYMDDIGDSCPDNTDETKLWHQRPSSPKSSTSLCFSPLLPQAKLTGCYYNEYATNIAPWNVGGQGFHRLFLDASQKMQSLLKLL